MNPTPVTDEQLAAAREAWDALKQQECSDPQSAVRIAMLSKESFLKAMTAWLVDREARVRQEVCNKMVNALRETRENFISTNRALEIIVAASQPTEGAV